ncbi:MAG: FHA domain-containing protein, partial [Myxococcota bacterium]
MPNLKWVAPEGRPRSFPIFKKITTIGRAATNDVAIDDGRLEEFHAQLIFDGRDFSLSTASASAALAIGG